MQKLVIVRPDFRIDEKNYLYYKEVLDDYLSNGWTVKNIVGAGAGDYPGVYFAILLEK